MDFSQLSLGAKIAIGAGIALAVSPFLHWYGVSYDIPGHSIDAPILRGWEIFSYTDIALFTAGVLVVALGVLGAVERFAVPRVPGGAGRLVTGIGAVAAVLVLYRMLWVPGPDGQELTREAGIVVALVASVGAAYAGTLLADD